jgi:hypothetical protein
MDAKRIGECACREKQEDDREFDFYISYHLLEQLGEKKQPFPSRMLLLRFFAFGRLELRSKALPGSAAALSGPRRGNQAVSIIACSQPLSSYTTPCDVSGDIATNPDEAHDTTWGMAGVPYIAMASS